MEIPQSKFFTGVIMKNFFAGLFDFKFNTFVTKSVASVLYAITTGLVLLGTALVLTYALIQLGSSPAEAVLLLVVGPLAGILTLTILRVAFESSIALISIAINTKK